jgi:valyl-tRNA synthetase
MPVEPITLRDGRTVNTSPKFDLGRNFCNKLWNSARFTFMNLAELSPEPFAREKMQLEDRWILSRLTSTVASATAALEAFQFHDCVETIYEFFWNDFCDWYLEVTKPRMREAATRSVPQHILAYTLDRLLRLLHPFVPHITELLWRHLSQLVPDRSLDAAAPAPAAAACIVARWPEAVAAFRDPQAETDFALVQAAIRAIRNIRARMNIAPRQPLVAVIRAQADAAARLTSAAETIKHLALLSQLTADPAATKPHASAAEVVEALEVFVPLAGVIDLDVERSRLAKRQAELEKVVQGIEKKLSNENFVARAKPEVVQNERERLAKFQAELAALQANLRDLE